MINHSWGILRRYFWTYSLFVEGGALVRVPVVITCFPGKFGRERREHVVEGPRQDDVVVTVEKENDDGRCKTDACKTGLIV